MHFPVLSNSRGGGGNLFSSSPFNKPEISESVHRLAKIVLFFFAIIYSTLIEVLVNSYVKDGQVMRAESHDVFQLTWG